MISGMQILHKLEVSDKFAPFIGKSVEKLRIHLKWMKSHLISAHVVDKQSEMSMIIS